MNKIMIKNIALLVLSIYAIGSFFVGSNDSADGFTLSERKLIQPNFIGN